jgi:DNA-binding transcriptional ArsR family regulator
MLDTILHAIAEPHRREILRLVQDSELSAGEIAAYFTQGHDPVTRPAISQHLKVLSDAGLVTVRRHGTQRLYRVRLEGLEELKEFLAGFWDDHLQKLKKVVEAEERYRNDNPTNRK